MTTILGCEAFGHNIWLVLLAAAICVAGGWVVIRLLRRALEAQGNQRLGWAFLAAFASGASIWCTHFVAVLAYDPGTPIGFDPVLTIVSAIVAVAGAAAGFSLTAVWRAPWAPTLGGCLIGLSIAAMHYSGMLAYRVEGLVSWAPSRVALSLALGLVFSVAAMHAASHEGAGRGGWASVGLLTLAIVGLHFTAMSALRISPLLIDPSATNHDAVLALGLAIAGMALLVLAAGLVSFLIDRSARKESDSELQHMALHDELTGLPNRAHFQEEIAARAARASGERTSLSLIVIDLDRFQRINDRFGLQAGDQALRRFGGRLGDAMRDSQFAARLGGDQFAVLHGSHGESLDDLLARLHEELSRPFDCAGARQAFAVSIGVAAYPSDASDVETLIGAADLARQRARAEGGDRIRFFDRSADERERARRRLVDDLRSAIAANELQVFYQAQKAIAGGATTGYEALLRWRHPQLGFIPPSEFIPLAEDNGLIGSLGAWVLRRACAEAAAWDRPYKVAVNVSAMQLSSTDLPALVRATLAETGLPATRLELELTESAVVVDAERSLAIIREVRRMGATIALDDFGVGYSSLSTLRQFPFDKIKLDRSFMSEIEASRQARAIVRAVLAIGRAFEIPVLAEGIETEAQLATLRAEGCDEAQGYLLGRPAPMAQLVAEGHLRSRRGGGAAFPLSSAASAA